MDPIHTIVFELDEFNLPLPRNVFPTTARTLNIMTQPEKYGWRASTSCTQDNIVHINMKSMGIETNTILNFIRTIRNNEIRSTQHAIQKMEYFAILIGANQDKDCPFYNIIEKFYTSQKNQNNKLEEENERIYSNPNTPQQDIHELYHWDVASTISARSRLPLDEWSVCAPASSRSDGIILDWFFRKKRQVPSVLINKTN